VRRNLAIVPAFNEVEAIATTVASIHETAPDFDVLVVDDGSSDATAERAVMAGARVLRMPFNLGIGGAMQSGYMYALENGYEIADSPVRRGRIRTGISQLRRRWACISRIASTSG
jgi:glycosyltransferase involved in cell wall biosynthesis